jgi:ParB family chromosome partitioning protein
MVREIIQLKLEDVQISGQVRKEFTESSLQELASSFLQVGQLQPVIVQRIGDRYLLLAGERRLRAAQLAGLASIDAIVEEANLSSSDVCQRQLIENLQRDELTPLEVAAGIKELMEATGWTASEVSGKLGLSAATVSRTLSLLRLPEGIKSQVRSGELIANVAYELGKIDDATMQIEIANKVIAEGLTRDGVSQMVKRKKSAAAVTDAKPSARAKIELGGGRSVTLSGPGLASLSTAIEWLQEVLAKAKKADPALGLKSFVRVLKDKARV